MGNAYGKSPQGQSPDAVASTASAPAPTPPPPTPGRPLPAALPRTTGVAAELIPGQRSLGSQQIPDNQTDHFGSYSWLWWVNGVDRDGVRMWPNAPEDVFCALGHKNGQRGIAVIPSLDMVVSWNDTTLGDHPEKERPLNVAFQKLMAAVK